MQAINIEDQIVQLQHQIAQQQQQFGLLQQQQQAQQQQQQQFVAQMQQFDVRQVSRHANASISADDQGIEELVDLAGNVPLGFPADTADLRTIHGPVIDGLLQAYGQQTNGTVAVRRRRLAFFLGLAHRF